MLCGDVVFLSAFFSLLLLCTQHHHHHLSGSVVQCSVVWCSATPPFTAHHRVLQFFTLCIRGDVCSSYLSGVADPPALCYTPHTPHTIHRHPHLQYSALSIQWSSPYTVATLGVQLFLRGMSGERSAVVNGQLASANRFHINGVVPCFLCCSAFVGVLHIHLHFSHGVPSQYRDSFQERTKRGPKCVARQIPVHMSPVYTLVQTYIYICTPYTYHMY